jgi:hypothetical protein
MDRESIDLNSYYDSEYSETESELSNSETDSIYGNNVPPLMFYTYFQIHLLS